MSENIVISEEPTANLKIKKQKYNYAIYQKWEITKYKTSGVERYYEWRPLPVDESES
jgi:hypothetical protein